MNDAEQLERLAHDCLRVRYQLPPVRLQLLSVHSFNTIFRVDAPDGVSVLRIGAGQRIHAPGVEDVEALWLDSLGASGFATARNLAAVDGSRWASVGHPDVVGDRIATRFSWVDGDVLGSRIDDASATCAGQLLARLHDHATQAMATASVPASLHARSAVYFGDQNLVTQHRSDHGALFCEAIDRVQREIDARWAQGDTPHLLHGDFGPHNVLTQHGVLHPIDFQDLRFGFAIQDLGITISDLSRSAPDLVAPLVRGYGEVRELPDLSPQVLGTLAAERSLNIMNLALLSPGSGIGAAFAPHAERVVAWMTGDHAS